jgi:hypothetical protein
MPDDLADLINKRLTLNLFIQGAATHAFLGAHYLVEPELNQLDPQLVPLYDQVAIGAFLLYWHDEVDYGIGRPSRFWRKVKRGRHLFSRHPLLAKHGESLADAARQHALDKANEKHVFESGDAHDLIVFGAFHTLAECESRVLMPLADLAVQTAAEIWKFDSSRLRGAITPDCEVGNVRTPRTLSGNYLREHSGGWSCVEREGGRLVVHAKGVCWPLLLHELVKGVAEIVCLHGLNTLDRETYASVIDVTDHIEYESWMMQAGSELWRRFLKVKPANRLLAQSLMQIARLEPEPLQQLAFAIVEEPDMAADWLDSL